MKKDLDHDYATVNISDVKVNEVKRAFDYNDLIAIEQISFIRKELEETKETDVISDHEFWDFVNYHWGEWRDYDSDECSCNDSWDYFKSINSFWTEKIIKEFNKQSTQKKYDYEIIQLCEIAYVTSQLIAKGKIEVDVNDMQQMFDDVYLPILTEWKTGIQDGIFKDVEEEGYIDAYAHRRLLEQYGINWRERI